MITKTETPTGTNYKNDSDVDQTFYVDRWITLKPGEAVLITKAQAAAVSATGRHPRKGGGR